MNERRIISKDIAPELYSIILEQKAKKAFSYEDNNKIEYYPSTSEWGDYTEAVGACAWINPHGVYPTLFYTQEEMDYYWGAHSLKDTKFYQIEVEKFKKLSETSKTLTPRGEPVKKNDPSEYNSTIVAMKFFDRRFASEEEFHHELEQIDLQDQLFAQVDLGIAKLIPSGKFFERYQIV